MLAQSRVHTILIKLARDGSNSSDAGNIAAVAGGAAVGLGSYQPLKNLQGLAAKRENRQAWLRSLKGGAIGAVAAPLVLGAGKPLIKDDLPGKRLTQAELASTVRRGDLLIAGKAHAATSGGLGDKGTAIMSGTPNAYHGSVVSGIDPKDGSIWVSDHGPSGGATRKIPLDKDVFSVLRPTEAGRGEKLVHNMGRRSFLISKIYEDLRGKHGLSDHQLGNALHSFYPPSAIAKTIAARGFLPAVDPGMNARKLKTYEATLSNMDKNMDKILTYTAAEIKRTGKLPSNSELKAFNAMCNSALAQAGAPLGGNVNPNLATSADFFRAAEKGMYSHVGHYLPEGVNRASATRAFAARYAVPAAQAAIGFGAGTLAHRALQGNVAKKAPLLLRNAKLTAAAAGMATAGAGLLYANRSKDK